MPIIFTVPTIRAIIGTRDTVCVIGDSAGTNGSTFWTVDGKTVNAIDVSNLTNPGNSDAVNYTKPICDICNCHGNYFNEDAVRSVVDQQLERNNYAAFIVYLFIANTTIDLGFRGRLCYGIPNRFLSVLVIKEVDGTDRGVGVDFTITSVRGRSETRHFSGSIGQCLHYFHSCFIFVFLCRILSTL